jgi:translation initiation factor 5
MLNVDPNRADDQFYRYKMPRIQTKIESGGNGIKTVIPNIEQVAQVLNRDVQLPMKFMGQHIGSSAKLKDSKWMLMGKVEREEVQKLIFSFIEKFVLCKECRNPETIIQVDDEKFQNIWLSCKACSRVTGVDPKDKLCALIIKTEKPVPIVRKRDEKRKPEKTKDQKEEELFNKVARQAQDGDVIEDDAPEKPNPIEVLQKFMKEGEKSDSEIASKVWDIKQDYGLGDRHVVSLIFESVFDEDIANQIKPRAKLVKRLLKTETERDLIINLMCLCKEKETVKPKFPILLKKFYDEEVITEKAVIEWFEDSKTSRLLKKEDQALFKEKCKPFIQWLKEADEDEESEEEEA